MTQPTYERVSPSANPAQAQALIDRALAPQAPSVPDRAPTIDPAPDTNVTLLAGIEMLDGDDITDAQVRELTGADEEKIAKAGNLSKFIETLLLCGVESIGSEKPSRDTFGKMLAADLDVLLLEIRIATFGRTIEFDPITCLDCGHKEAYKVDLRDDVPSKAYDGDREWEQTLPSGKTVTLQLIDGDIQRALAQSTERTQAALNTLVLSKCVSEIDGFPVLGQDAVRNLSVRDRQAAIEAIGEKTPGPRLSEVSRSCPECSAEIALPLALTDLFRF